MGRFLAQNWLLILLAVGMVGMHLFGHRGHGGHGGHGGQRGHGGHDGRLAPKDAPPKSPGAGSGEVPS